jgi:ribose transport system substrate-binding protein
MRRMTSTSTRLIRGFAVVTAAVAVVTAACGPAVPGAAPNTSATQSPSGAKATSGKKFTIGWSLALFDHPVYQIMIKAANDAAEKRGVNLLIANGKKDPAVQASDIDNFLAQGVDAIMLTPQVSDPLIPAVKKVNGAGIPFVNVDRRMFSQGSGIKWDALIGWCMVCSGTISGEETVKALTQPDGTVKGNLVVIEGSAGAGSTIDRGNGFYDVISKYPGINVIYKADGDFDRAKSLGIMENVLQRFPTGQIDAVYSMADEMTAGAMKAIKNAGRLHEFKVISVDGQKEVLDMLRAGEIDYDGIFFPQDQSVFAINLLTDMLEGKTPQWDNQVNEGRKADALKDDEGHPWVRPGYFAIDKSNANDPQNVGW